MCRFVKLKRMFCAHFTCTKTDKIVFGNIDQPHGRFEIFQWITFESKHARHLKFNRMEVGFSLIVASDCYYKWSSIQKNKEWTSNGSHDCKRAFKKTLVRCLPIQWGSFNLFSNVFQTLIQCILQLWTLVLHTKMSFVLKCKPNYYFNWV